MYEHLRLFSKAMSQCVIVHGIACPGAPSKLYGSPSIGIPSYYDGAKVSRVSWVQVWAVAVGSKSEHATVLPDVGDRCYEPPSGPAL